MEFGNFIEFIYFNLLAISVNFPYQLVIVICNPNLKTELHLGMDWCWLLFFAQLKSMS